MNTALSILYLEVDRNDVELAGSTLGTSIRGFSNQRYRLCPCFVNLDGIILSEDPGNSPPFFIFQGAVFLATILYNRAILLKGGL
jgi:hypothetical protein